MMKVIIGTIFFFIPALALSASWNCQNHDMEIKCDSEKCRQTESGGFTPFDIGVNANGSIDICAYSGCWHGKGKVLKSAKYILVSGSNLKWIGATSGSGDFVVAIDKRNRTGFIMGEGFAMPVICKESK